MGAKIVLSGEAQNIQREGDVITFTLHTGPATRHPPPGLQLYDSTRYQVACSAALWERAYPDQSEPKSLFIEGYLEPRQEDGTGSLYIAVAATVLQSMLARNQHRLKRLEQSLEDARKAFKVARDAGASQQGLEEKASALIQANQTLTRFLERHPDLAREGSD